MKSFWNRAPLRDDVSSARVLLAAGLLLPERAVGPRVPDLPVVADVRHDARLRPRDLVVLVAAGEDLVARAIFVEVDALALRAARVVEGLELIAALPPAADGLERAHADGSRSVVRRLLRRPRRRALVRAPLHL